ncbi:MAG: hypothetical protein QNJ47_12040 [Nostocaceae cyanobacterium]|nr:hypothetical protein [Nostocaceae cyanobacterium]
MAKIKVNDIKPTGTELFEDVESFLSEVSNDELESTIGGTMIAYDSIIQPTPPDIYPCPQPTPPVIDTCPPFAKTVICIYSPVIL